MLLSSQQSLNSDEHRIVIQKAPKNKDSESTIVVNKAVIFMRISKYRNQEMIHRKLNQQRLILKIKKE
jgi:hypothetical protein